MINNYLNFIRVLLFNIILITFKSFINIQKIECICKHEGGRNMLTKIINNLFIATRYGVWTLGVLGIIASIILIPANASLGMSSTVIFIATLLVAITVALILLPQKLVINNFLKKRSIIATITGFLAIGLVAVIYYTNNGFPQLNLLFI